MTRGYLCLVAAGAIWGSIGVIVREIPLPVHQVVFGRVLLGSLLLFAYGAITGEARWPERAPLLLLGSGVLLALNWLALFTAFRRVPVAVAILVAYIAPVLVAAIARPALGERVSSASAAALGASLLGIGLVAAPALRGRLDAVGVAAALASALAFAALLLAGKILTRLYPPSAIAAWQTGLATLALLPWALGTDLPSARLLISPRAGGLLLLLGAVHTAAAGILYFRGLSSVPAHHAGILAYLEPTSGILWAWALLGESPTPLTLLGGALVLAGGASLILLGGHEQPPGAAPLKRPSEPGE